jgi:hypothetical protein
MMAVIVLPPNRASRIGVLAQRTIRAGMPPKTIMAKIATIVIGIAATIAQSSKQGIAQGIQHKVVIIISSFLFNHY